MKIILYFLWFLGLISFTIILYNAYCLYVNGESYFGLLAPSGILISAFIASFSVMRNIENTNQNDTSKFYVEKCEEGFDIVYNLLKDKNNNPSTWIEAARILKYTLELSNNIKVKSFKKIYEIKVFQYRHLLLKSLTNEYGHSLPTSFFFGIKDWEELKVEEAQKIAEEQNRSSGWIEKYEITPYPKGAYIPESAIKVIFDFISYDDEFDDPLEDEKIENLEKWHKEGGIHIIKDGAFNYLKFQKAKLEEIKAKYSKKPLK